MEVEVTPQQTKQRDAILHETKRRKVRGLQPKMTQRKHVKPIQNKKRVWHDTLAQGEGIAHYPLNREPELA